MNTHTLATRYSPLATRYWGVLAIFVLLILQACDVSVPQSALTPYDIQNNWSIGSTVQLARGTEIREAPSNTSCWHTRVPVDRWEVQVIGVGNNGWYNTSRKALDPSG